MDNARKVAGVVGFFNDPDALIEATRKVREARYKNFDAFTPYPVHGLDDAQGLKRSPIPFVTFAAGLTGCSLGFLLEYWTSAVDWPLIVGGKPFNSLPAFIPIMFECTILFAGLCTVAAMFLINGLPNVFRKSFDPSLTRDRFAIMIEAPRPPLFGGHGLGEEDEEDKQIRLEKERKKNAGFKEFSESEAQAFLKQLGAADVKSVYAEGWF
jgi:hypothetical protein